MYRQSVESSNLAEVGYDQDTQKLQVMFKNGGLYEYDRVPFNVYQELLDSPSVGSYFHYNIKDRYETVKLA